MNNIVKLHNDKINLNEAIDLALRKLIGIQLRYDFDEEDELAIKLANLVLVELRDLDDDKILQL